MNTPAEKNNPRSVFGWCMYDWANSAFSTTVVAGLLPAYFSAAIVPNDGAVLFGHTFSATTLWGFAISAATAVAFLASPVLGAIADFTAAKKKFLLLFAYLGSLFATLLFLCQTGDVVMTLVFFVIAQASFVSANVFYDAFLPQLVTEDRLDRISSRGYAFGYIGGGLQFAIALGLYAGHDSLGIDKAMAARIGMALAGMWWAGFTLFTALWVRERPPVADMPERYQHMARPVAVARVGIDRTLATARQVARYRHLLLFLVAFMLYNDGIQTVINMASMYGKSELGLETTDLMITLLIVQFVAMVGAFLFARIAETLGTKHTVMLTLVLWSGVVIYAYFITTRVEFFVLGMIVGLVLGGSQALSRSFYSSMIPENASAEFFGFYTVFSKFSAIWGPLVFALISHFTKSARLSIISLMAFFIVGLVLLAFVDEKKGRVAWKPPAA